MALNDRLYDNLKANLPGAVDGLINVELWNTVNDFCRTAFIWRETISITLVEGQTTYPLAPAGTEVVTVFYVSSDGMDASQVLYELGNIYTSPPTAAEAASPLFVVAALAPALTAGVDIEALIPSDMWSTYHQLLLDGVKARMMAQPGKPYSNPNLAAFHMRSYNNQKMVAKREVATGFEFAPQSWAFPRWA